jgi:regulator of protease activity HflC (stomatin/prohibitin superfamily)
MKFNRVNVRKTERAVLLRNGDFERVLEPGKYVFPTWFDKISVERHEVAQPLYIGAAADYLLATPTDSANEHFVRVELNDTQAGLLYENDSLVELLPPATRRLYWKTSANVRVETVELSGEGELAKDLIAKITHSQLKRRAVAGLQAVLQVQVPEFNVGLLTIDGKLVRSLAPGAYAYWRFNRNVAVEYVDLRVQALEVTGQEILTRDKVALRLNLGATWRYADVLKAFATTAKPVDNLYRELQFALRAAVGTQSLDELLENKTALDEKVAVAVRERMANAGIALEAVGVKDIILPGEMKAILAQVVEAEKVAQANLIRRREETAASRSLLNTAKVMEDNPVALRLKELETLERVAERIDKISVFGGLDGVLNALAKVK